LISRLRSTSDPDGQPSVGWASWLRERMTNTTKQAHAKSMPHSGVSNNVDTSMFATDSYADLSGTWSTLADSFLYQPVSGMPYAWRFGNNRPRLLTYDNDGRLAKIDSTTAVQQMDIGYDAGDRIHTRSNNLDTSKSATYGYDGTSRLTSSTRTAGNESFTWDLVGNRTSQNSPSGNYNLVMDTLAFPHHDGHFR